MLVFTRHARVRCAQRAIPHDAIEAALAWGREYAQPSRHAVYFLGRRQVDAAARMGVDVGRFENTAIVFSADGAVVTAIRTRSPRRFRPRRR